MDKPKFIQLIKTNYPAGVSKASIEAIIDDVLHVSVHRGLNDAECDLLLQFFLKGPLNMTNKIKLLEKIVPENKVPAAAMRKFMAWFITNIKKDKKVISMANGSRILQWIIGLLEYNLVDSGEINNFYHDFYVMLECPSLVPFVAKLLCKLTKPDDVTSQTVRTLCSNFNSLRSKYLVAVLNVFKGYKPHLVPNTVKNIDVNNVLNYVRHSMDLVMRARARIVCDQEHQEPSRTLGITEIHTKNSSLGVEQLNQTSSLIPLPTYDVEEMNNSASFIPNRIDQASRSSSRISLPKNPLSLLQSDLGFFQLTYQGIEAQIEFQDCLFLTLQNALIYQELQTSNEDLELFFRRVYCLQMFMQQGIPSVSVFLSRYLLDWDGVNHRYNILKLIEWATFHSFRELVCNILRPLHILFVTNNSSVKREIIQTLINLIRNMFADVSRVQQGIRFPFLKQRPQWTSKPESMLSSLISWTQNLITLGLCIEQDNSFLVMECIRFHEMITIFEVSCKLQMFTVISEEVVLQSLLIQSPNTIIRICRLLLRYHRRTLPLLRLKVPYFYEQCKEKISLTSNYTQRIIYFLQKGQVVLPRKENEIIVRDVPKGSLAAGGESLCLTSHLCFVSTYVIFESKKNSLNLSKPDDRRLSLKLAKTVHLKVIDAFLNFFFPSVTKKSRRLPVIPEAEEEEADERRESPRVAVEHTDKSNWNEQYKIRNKCNHVCQLIYSPICAKSAFEGYKNFPNYCHMDRENGCFNFNFNFEHQGECFPWELCKNCKR